MEKTFDIGIIGGGPAGYSYGLYASSQGKSVVLFERDKLGGTCLNRGCIPTKAFMHVSQKYLEARDSEKLGIIYDGLSFDFEKAVEYKNNVVQKLLKSLESVIKNAKIVVVNKSAKAISKTEIDSDGEIYHCKKIVLATGSKPVDLKGLERDGEFILNSDDILNMKKLPKSIAIIGSGAIGTEWARILSNFGVDVSVIELADRLVPLADWEVSKRVERIFKQKKIGVYLSTSVSKVDGRTLILSDNSRLEPECVLCAVGRKPDIDDNLYGLEVIGDACDEVQLAHYAIHQAKNLALGINFDKNLVPSVIYGSPEIAWVGKVSKSRENDEEYEKSVVPISALAKSHCDNAIDGFIKILSKSGKIEGVSIVSNEASSLVQQMVIAIQNDIGVDKLKEICYPHPTYSEGIFEGVMRL